MRSSKSVGEGPILFSEFGGLTFKSGWFNAGIGGLVHGPAENRRLKIPTVNGVCSLFFAVGRTTG
ncbi:hypothetical protein AUJ14_05215 [Candidatus Micrarchaeota archaeon CG1_02_55_22]|nr:MAG: hypothetical protein AUJ14_05215 [Candidatus Micrarchaeota archaeon CG1_02_55_22]